jgi:hypothetical protein
MWLPKNTSVGASNFGSGKNREKERLNGNDLNDRQQQRDQLKPSPQLSKLVM